MILEKSCGAVIVHWNTDRFEFLLIQQIDGHWGFPKGHIEPGESEEETALREIEEETGLRVHLLPDFRSSTEYEPAPQHWKEVVYFIGFLNQEQRATPQPTEIAELRWLSEGEALLHLTYQNDRDLLRLAASHLRHLPTFSLLS